MNRETRWAEYETHVENDIHTEGLLAQTGRCHALSDFTTIERARIRGTSCVPTMQCSDVDGYERSKT